MKKPTLPLSASKTKATGGQRVEFVDIMPGKKFPWTDLQLGRCAMELINLCDAGLIRSDADIRGMFDDHCACSHCTGRNRVFQLDYRRYQKQVLGTTRADAGPVLERVSVVNRSWDGGTGSDTQESSAVCQRVRNVGVQTINVDELAQGSETDVANSDFDFDEKLAGQGDKGGGAAATALTTAAKRRGRKKRVQERWKKSKAEQSGLEPQ
jgi:hypothetical protein